LLLILLNTSFDEAEWIKICSQYPPIDLNRKRKAIFSKIEGTRLETWTDEDIHGDVIALNRLFEVDAVPMNYVRMGCHLGRIAFVLLLVVLLE
jgi:hypothetical protein